MSHSVHTLHLFLAYLAWFTKYLIWFHFCANFMDISLLSSFFLLFLMQNRLPVALLCTIVAYSHIANPNLYTNKQICMWKGKANPDAADKQTFSTAPSSFSVSSVWLNILCVRWMRTVLMSKRDMWMLLCVADILARNGVPSALSYWEMRCVCV